jgi:alkaline phosphatase D
MGLPPYLNRRELLKASVTLASSLATGSRIAANPRFDTDPFRLGVASGDPWPDSVVLWTRLAPDPLNGGGMPPETVPVRWRVASDEGMTKIVRQGTTMASPGWAHSVHVEVQGLQPGRWYWYQFDVGTAGRRMLSPLGRTRTAPAPASHPDRYSFAFVSCQKYESGYYTAIEHLSAEDLSLVVHLGDYIYEKGPAKAVREMPLPTAISLDQYRARYAFYKMDPALQKVHHSFPWAVVPDDHEVSNNYAGLIPEKKEDGPTCEVRRAAAYRAYYEHMPLRAVAAPHGAFMTLHRTLRIGQLADLHLLDTRQYRTDQPCGDGTKPSCAEREGPSTMMGPAQERWLHKQLAAAHSKWNVLAQQVIFGQIDCDPGPGELFMMDKWDGYPVARQRLLEQIAARKLGNVIVLSGDNHNNWVIEIKRDFREEKSPILASEFAGTSLSSGGDGSEIHPGFTKVFAANPHIKFHNSRRGYVRCTVTPELWTSDYRVVPYVSRPGAPIQTRASFVVESGKPGVERQS